MRWRERVRFGGKDDEGKYPIRVRANGKWIRVGSVCRDAGGFYVWLALAIDNYVNVATARFAKLATAKNYARNVYHHNSPVGDKPMFYGTSGIGLTLKVRTHTAHLHSGRWVEYPVGYTAHIRVAVVGGDVKFDGAYRYTGDESFVFTEHGGKYKTLADARDAIVDNAIVYYNKVQAEALAKQKADRAASEKYWKDLLDNAEDKTYPFTNTCAATDCQVVWGKGLTAWVNKRLIAVIRKFDDGSGKAFNYEVRNADGVIQRQFSLLRDAKRYVETEIAPKFITALPAATAEITFTCAQLPQADVAFTRDVRGYPIYNSRTYFVVNDEVRGYIEIDKQKQFVVEFIKAEAIFGGPIVDGFKTHKAARRFDNKCFAQPNHAGAEQTDVI